MQDCVDFSREGILLAITDIKFNRYNGKTRQNEVKTAFKKRFGVDPLPFKKCGDVLVVEISDELAHEIKKNRSLDYSETARGRTDSCTMVCIPHFSILLQNPLSIQVLSILCVIVAHCTI